MGNCLLKRNPFINRVSSNAKSESPRVKIPSSVQVQEREQGLLRVSAENPLMKLPSNPEEVEDLRRDSAANPLIAFTFDELKEITANFRQDNILGGGGFGIVYKGFVTEDFRKGLQPLEVAVKVHSGDNSFQGHREWLAEVLFLGQLSHPNLVKLIGYCCEDNHRVLIYEFMARGNVEAYLFSRSLPRLPWAIRMKIALGAANGLAFLHEAKTPVIYRDFKTSNILLDPDYNSKLSDFGLAKAGPVGEMSHVSTRIMGTRGYAAPEYMLTDLNIVFERVSLAVDSAVPWIRYLTWDGFSYPQQSQELSVNSPEDDDLSSPSPSLISPLFSHYFPSIFPCAL